MNVFKALFIGNELENKEAFKRMQIIAAGIMGVTPILAQTSELINQVSSVTQASLALFSVFATVSTSKTIGLKQ